MNETDAIARRNAIVEEHLPCIVSVMRRNRELIRAARLEWADVYQQLALRLIRAVDSFDPAKGTLRQHIYAQLKYELLSSKTPHRLESLITSFGLDFLLMKDRHGGDVDTIHNVRQIGQDEQMTYKNESNQKAYE